MSRQASGQAALLGGADVAAKGGEQPVNDVRDGWLGGDDALTYE